jgi:hypothetical protein
MSYICVIMQKSQLTLCSTPFLSVLVNLCWVFPGEYFALTWLFTRWTSDIIGIGWFPNAPHGYILCRLGYCYCIYMSGSCLNIATIQCAFFYHCSQAPQIAITCYDVSRNGVLKDQHLPAFVLTLRPHFNDEPDWKWLVAITLLYTKLGMWQHLQINECVKNSWVHKFTLKSWKWQHT